ncbi:uncharacterized protein LOC110033461 [Phalaenopsis equestris]|nr:uncharacterized protein LOC110033461 [Phalaenopsis equestris]
MANNSLAAMVPQDLSSSDLRSLSHMHFSNENLIFSNPQISSGDSSFMSASALLQRAADMSGSSLSDESLCPLFLGAEMGERRSGGMTKDFLGLGDSGCPGGRSSGNGGYFENEFYSCQQMSHGWTPFEKDMWH